MQSLRRVLAVYSLRHPATGYVQVSNRKCHHHSHFCHRLKLSYDCTLQGMNDLATPFFYVFIRDELTDVDVGGSSDEDSSGDAVLSITNDTLSPSSWLRVEAYSFWCVSRLMEGIQEHYTKDQPGIQVPPFFTDDITSIPIATNHRHRLRIL